MGRHADGQAVTQQDVRAGALRAAGLDEEKRNEEGREKRGRAPGLIRHGVWDFVLGACNDLAGPQ